jgi:hypothetical protein
MKKNWKIKASNLKPLHAHALGIAKDIPNISYNHVKREFNKEADAIANKAVDTRADDVTIAPAYNIAQDAIVAAFGASTTVAKRTAAALASQSSTTVPAASGSLGSALAEPARKAPRREGGRAGERVDLAPGLSTLKLQQRVEGLERELKATNATVKRMEQQVQSLTELVTSLVST